MNIVDIPSQLANAYKYSERRWTALLLSLTVAVFVTAFSFDLIYSFFYTRINNVEQALYGTAYWIAIGALSIGLPLIAAVSLFLRTRKQLHPFQGGKFGIVIAPFQVTSTEVDTLSTATKLQALDEVMKQFFNATQELLNDEEWASDFEFRFLPLNKRIKTKNEAMQMFNSLGATLLIWRVVLQEQKLSMVIHLTGVEVDLKVTGSVRPFFFLDFIKVVSLFSASKLFEQQGKYQNAKRYLEHALSPARKLKMEQTIEKSLVEVTARVQAASDFSDQKLRDSVGIPPPKVAL